MPFTQKLSNSVIGNWPICRRLPRALLLKDEAVDIVGERSDGAQCLNGIEAKGHHRLKLLIKSTNGGRAELPCSGDDASAVRMGKQGCSIGAHATRKPLLPALTGTRWAYAYSPNEGVDHRVQEFLFVVEVPVERRRLNSQLVCETSVVKPSSPTLLRSSKAVWTAVDRSRDGRRSSCLAFLLILGGMIYEPASVIKSADGLHLSQDRIERNGEVGEGLRRARQALVSGKPGIAIGIFTHFVAGWPSFLANPAGALTVLVPAYRGLIACQIDDLEAMERLGVRLDAYSRLNLPIAMVCGERSPDCNKEMVAAVADVLPGVERITLSGQGHGCHVRDPQKLAEVIETFAKMVFE